MKRAATALAAVALVVAAPVSAAKKHPPKGPSVAVAKQSIAAVMKEAYAPIFGGPEDVDVKFVGKVRVLKAIKEDPNGGVPNHAGGKIWVWPVKAKGIRTVHRADGSVSQTCKFGTWTNNSFRFYRAAQGRGWAWYSHKDDPHQLGGDVCTSG
jgi:hypothetical protein